MLVPRYILRALVAATALSVACGFAAFPTETPTPLKSGLQPGERVPTFYVRAVTGSLKNKSVCYVCRNGDRPSVMILAREATPELATLLRGIDHIVDQNRAQGLRAFGVFVGTDDGRDFTSRVQTFAFDEKLAIPLTIAPTPPEGPVGQKLHPTAALTIILYRDQNVVANFAYRTGELTPRAIENVLDAVKQLPLDP